MTITDIVWRNQNDSDVFNLHALISITLSDLESGIVTIEGLSGRFKAPFCQLHLGGGFTHLEFLTKHPYQQGEYINIAVFDKVVAIAHCPHCCVPGWFDHKCRTYVPTF